jgi:hypothetical protein
MKRFFLFLTAIFVFTTFSCSREREEQPVFTTQLQYDVVLKNPDSVPDTWHRYMADSTRIRFLKNIIDPVLAGEVMAYAWKSNKLEPVSVTQLKDRFNQYISKAHQDNPGTATSMKILDEVSKIRYFEEWKLYRKKLAIDKRILAISVIHDSYTDQGEYRGTEPLFYIFYDKDFLAKYEKMSLE